MRKEYDFSGARRGPVIPETKGKTRITIPLDDDVLAWFKARVHEAGGGNYQMLINDALRTIADGPAEPLEDVVRRIVREELESPARHGRVVANEDISVENLLSGVRSGESGVQLSNSSHRVFACDISSVKRACPRSAS